ncbi:carboxypeptidase-like regulatory domain-containing protein [Marinifilum caeruleilacunae]|uniref:carboxypeptidase-like regulatory domain-containing protein n=1 Tax=Marinifilum caeruleilacunae TaxID=2499076 RepID=UPI0014911A24
MSIIFLVILCIGKSMSQSKTVTIKGTVLDPNDNAIPFATVYENNTENGTVTDENGEFKITVSIKSNVELVFRNLGFQEKRIIIQQSSNPGLIVVLEPSLEKINEVDIIAKSTSTKIEEKGFTAISLPVKELQTQSIEINQVLSQSAGVRVRQQGGLGSRVNYSINGLEGKAVRFFLDGIPMDYFGSSFSAATIPISQISRIDIYKGVVPVELGSDALGGAVNLVSKKDVKNNLDFSYSFGSFNTHKVSLSGFWRNKNNGLTGKISAFYNYSDNNYKVWGNDIKVDEKVVNEDGFVTYVPKRGITVERFHDAFESKTVKADFGFTGIDQADQVFIGLLLSGMDKEIQHGATMFVPFGEATYEQSVIMPYLTYKKNNILTEGLSLNLFTSYSELIRSRVDTTRNIYNWLGEIEDEKRVLGGEQKRTLNKLTENAFLNRLNIGYDLSDNHSLGFNTVFTHVKRTDEDPLVTQKTDGYYAPQYFKKSVMGLSLQSKLIDQRLQTNLFAKSYYYWADIKVSTTEAGVTSYETVSSSKNSFGIGIASSFELNENFLISASLEHANRLPEANEVLGDGLNIISNPHLKPESSFNANLGFNWNINLDSDNRIQLVPNLFYRNVSQKLKMVTASDPGLFQFVNFDKVRIKGIDGRIQFFHKQSIRLTQSVSYLNPVIKTDKDELGNDNGLANTRMSNTPFYQANSEARYNFKSWLKNNAQAFVYWRFKYVGSFYRYSEKFGSEKKDQVPKQNVNNFGIGYTFPNQKLSISADVNNIFNVQAFDNYAVQKPGRAFYIKINCKIF